MQAAWGKVKRFLRRPVFGTRVIPRDARVDPTKFAEDEFPTWCMKCGYFLRGLPDNICPECGTAFDRGHLLVQEYVFQRGALPLKQTPRWRLSKLLMITAIGLLALFAILAQLIKPQIVRWLVSAGPTRAIWLVVGVRFLPYVLIIVSAVLVSKNYRERARKRRAILTAIPRIP